MKKINKEKIIIDYLNKYYKVNKKRFVYRLSNTMEWGQIINEEISLIFDFNEKFCKHVFKKWARSRKLIDTDFKLAWGLFFRVDWTIAQAIDLNAQHGFYQHELENAMIQEILRLGIPPDMLGNVENL